NGGTYSASVDYQGFVRAGVFEKFADTADNFEIGSAETESFHVAEDEAKFDLEFGTYRVEATGGIVAAFEDGKCGWVLATAKIETEEEVRIETRHQDLSQSGRPPLIGS